MSPKGVLCVQVITACAWLAARRVWQAGGADNLAALYAERYADQDGRIRATFELIWVSGWSPDPSQPKPLKPGSGQTRLADALQQIRDQNSEPR